MSERASCSEGGAGRFAQPDRREWDGTKTEYCVPPTPRTHLLTAALPSGLPLPCAGPLRSPQVTQSGAKRGEECLALHRRSDQALAPPGWAVGITSAGPEH